MKITKLNNILKADGLLGLVEKLFQLSKKYLFTTYYRFRFRRFGRGSVVTGPISLTGGKRIELGSNVVIEGGVSFRVTQGGRISVGHHAFIEQGARLMSEGELVLGEKVCILKDAQIVSVGQVNIGNRVWVARGSSVGGKEVILEEDVILGPHVSIMDGDHYVEQGTGRITMHAGRRLPICIRANAWIGARSIILKGVTVGEGSIIGAGGVVTKDIPPHSVAVGVPAQVHKSVVGEGL